MHEWSSGGIGDEPGTLIAKAAEHVPYPLGGPLREWNARTCDVGGGSVGGAAFVLRLAWKLAGGGLIEYTGEQLDADRREFHVELARRPAPRQRN